MVQLLGCLVLRRLADCDLRSDRCWNPCSANRFQHYTSIVSSNEHCEFSRSCGRRGRRPANCDPAQSSPSRIQHSCGPWSRPGNCDSAQILLSRVRLPAQVPPSAFAQGPIAGKLSYTVKSKNGCKIEIHFKKRSYYIKSVAKPHDWPEQASCSWAKMGGARSAWSACCQLVGWQD